VPDDISVVHRPKERGPLSICAALLKIDEVFDAEHLGEHMLQVAERKLTVNSPSVAVL
jgi:hypothetical protein